MRVPVSWLKDYVDFDDTTDGLADKLTFSGIEVEGIETIGGDFAGVVVGEITNIEAHPNADRLTVCKVFDGQTEHQVVCGASNCEVGGRYPFAPVGSTLKGGFKIKKAKLRGMESHGMLCAEDELGLSNDHEGIMRLEGDPSPGTNFADVLGPPEVVLDLEITPNRPDCLSIIGIAREVAALYNSELRLPETELHESEVDVNSLTSVAVEDSEACPRYTARVLQGARIMPSPHWMAKRLELAGVRSINNIVDITNYVMLETGHPLHAFDHNLLSGGRIIVRRAHPGEKISTLDDVQRELSDDMLVISDAEKPVAVAGVMGGATSEINDATTNVLLESAYFDPTNIRITSKALALHSESSYRFSRGVNCNGVEWASRRAAALMSQCADAEIANGLIDCYPSPSKRKTIECRPENISRLLGVRVEKEDFIDRLQRLGLEVLESATDSYILAVPHFRGDLEREVDIAEEYARLYGFDNIPDAAPAARVVPSADDRHDRAQSVCRTNLVGLGLREIMNYSLVSQELLDTFGKDDRENRIILPHPISADQSILRTSLIPQMVESLGRNNTRQIREASFFELGKVFLLNEDGVRIEDIRISIGIMGARGRNSLARFKQAQAEEMFIWIKGIIENLLGKQNISDCHFNPGPSDIFSSAHSSTILIDGAEVGKMGVLKPSIASKWKMQMPIAVAEISLEPTLQNLFKRRSFREISTQPAIERDVALVARSDVKHEDVIRTIASASDELLEKVELFDIFTGKGIPEGHKSMAYALTYRAKDRTLTDEQANAIHQRIKDAIKKNLNVELRE